MAATAVPLLAFNRGLVSRHALARTDIERIALSASRMTNWMTRVLGPMALRVGTQYLGTTHSNGFARSIPFIFSTADVARIELSDLAMRVWVSDAVITRPSVSTAVTNGGFDTNVTGWSDNDETGATSQWEAGGGMYLTGNGTASAIRTQTLTIAAADQNVEHALNIVITRGPVVFRLGSTAGGDEYVTETELQTGVHSLAFTPGGASVYIRFSNALARKVIVDSCAVAAAGPMVLTTPWAAEDMSLIRYKQSADVVFVACEGHQQRRIERRAARSWSLVIYYSNDGPFLDENLTPTTITASFLTGNVSLTASKAIFRPEHVGALFKLRSAGQEVRVNVTAADQWTDPIRVTGVGDQRVFNVIRTGAWSATVTIQRSLEEPGTWVDVSSNTVNINASFDDGLDNQIAYYRHGVKAGDFTSGIVEIQLLYPLGSIAGVARVTSYSAGQLVFAEVLKPFGSDDPTTLWSEGRWSDFRGWPSAVTLHEGRLWWAGKDKLAGSVSDAYDSFDDDTEGDSGPIVRSIGSGPVDSIAWLLSLERLVVGTAGSELSARASSFDEPLTPTAFALRTAGTQGSALIDARQVDKAGIFLQRSGTRVYELAFDTQDYDYRGVDLTVLVPEIGEPSILGMAVQRQPETRIHCWRSDGRVAILVYDRAENVKAWILWETDGEVEDVTILPGVGEDAVYYTVKRTIDGSTVRYAERWALEDDCVGGTLNKQADSFVLYSGAATTTIAGLAHLEGESVVVWGDGVYLGTKTVSGGQITGLSQAVTGAVVGLGYTGQWRSTKLAFAGATGTPLGQKKRIAHLGLILADAHPLSLQYGPDFDNLDPMPAVEAGAPVDPDLVFEDYDEPAFPLAGSWDTDSRLCLQASAPLPCTVLAAVVQVETHEKR